MIGCITVYTRTYVMYVGVWIFMKVSTCTYFQGCCPWCTPHMKLVFMWKCMCVHTVDRHELYKWLYLSSSLNLVISSTAACVSSSSISIVCSLYSGYDWFLWYDLKQTLQYNVEQSTHFPEGNTNPQESHTTSNCRFFIPHSDKQNKKKVTEKYIINKI